MPAEQSVRKYNEIAFWQVLGCQTCDLPVYESDVIEVLTVRSHPAERDKT